MLPWWRDRLPLLYAGERLVAVGDLWIAEEFAARGGEDALRIVWEERPQLIAHEQSRLTRIRCRRRLHRSRHCARLPSRRDDW